MMPALFPETTRPGSPRPVDTRPPARPGGTPPPSVPRPGPARPSRLPVPSLRLAVALIAVGVLILTFRYFAPVLLLAALPTREWRAAAGVPAPPRRHRLLRFARAHVGAGVLRGAPAPTSNSPDGPALAASTLVGRETAALPG